MSDSRNAVAQVLERLRDGWARLDPHAVLACFADADDNSVIGTDAREYWPTSADFHGPFMAMAGAFSEARYRWVDEPLIWVQGDVAWAMGILVGEFVAPQGDIRLEMRTTHVLVGRGGDWRIVHAHYSVPAAEDTNY